MTKYTKQQVAEAKENLLKYLKEGDDVWFIIHSVAKNGTSRVMSCHVPAVGHDDKLYIANLTYYVAKVLDYKVLPDGGFRVHGCGMDMCFATVYDLSMVLFGRDKAYALNSRTI